MKTMLPTLPRRLSMGVILVAILVLHILPCTAQDVATYETDFAAFVAEVDNTYPFFDLKGVRDEWEAAKPQLAEKAAACTSDSEFLGVVVEAIGLLHDSHMWLRDTKAEIPPRPQRYYPGVTFLPANEGRVAVMWTRDELAGQLAPGTVVARIDGQDARAYLEQRAKDAWQEGFCSSPQRARMYEFRIPLRGEQGKTHTLTVLRDGSEEELTLTCDLEGRGWPHYYNLPEGLTREGRSCLLGKLPSGAGYIYLRRVDASAETGIRRALDGYADAEGWIVDLRGNGGGGYGEGLIDAIRSIPRPVAVLTDAGCMSAGETLARDLRRLADARVFGAPSAGASSAKRSWRFPSGIASVTFSTRSRWRGDGQPIEYNGIQPDVLVEAVPEEVASGLNSAIVRAGEYLREAYPAAAAARAREETLVADVTIEALVAGRVELHVSSEGIRWRIPTTVGGLDASVGPEQPTYVNGFAWTPEWPPSEDSAISLQSDLFRVRLRCPTGLVVQLLAAGVERGGDEVDPQCTASGEPMGEEFVVTLDVQNSEPRWVTFRVLSEN